MNDRQEQCEGGPEEMLEKVEFVREVRRHLKPVVAEASWLRT